MNPSYKSALLLLCITYLLGIGACKKDHANSQIINSPDSVANHLVLHPCDYGDSIVGTYYCIEHYYFWAAPNTITDSILGPFVVTISKTSLFDSTITINTQQIGTPTSYNNNSAQYAFVVGSSGPDGTGAPEFFYFVKQNDSIWFQNNLHWSNGYRYWNYYTGRKQ